MTKKTPTKKPIELATDGRNPWDQQPQESSRQHAIFRNYLNLGITRNCTKLAEKLEKSENYIRYLSRLYLWRERAAEYDIEQDEEYKKIVIEQRKQMALEHAKIADSMLGKVSEKLETINLDEIKPSELARWLDIGVKVKRYSFGDPDHLNIHLSGPDGEPVHLSIEDKRQRLEDLYTELKRRMRTDE